MARAYSNKGKKARKIILIVILSVVGAAVLFLGTVFVIHLIKSDKELKALKAQGYYNPVSVGDYSLNVAKFGNPDGKHTIVGMAGLGSGDYSVSARQMTACLEADNLVVFVDRAGYGLSDDTKAEQPLETIVEDYRKALKNAGLEAPYILLPHSIGGAYATWWVSKYPDEIEAVVFVDGTQISADVFEDERDEYHAPTFGDRALAFLAKTGLSRLALRKYYYYLPDDFSEEEQYLADALMLRTTDSIAPVSESGLMLENAQKAFNEIETNDVPKLYICSSWGIDSWETMIEYNAWISRQIEKNDLEPLTTNPADADESKRREVLERFEQSRREILYPYFEKMGNCKCVLLGGDHMIYEQKPEETGRLAKEFINGLD